VQKWWSIFFAVVLTATFVIWIVAPFAGWWLPTNVSTYGPDVDFLFYVILALTGFFFVLTEVLLCYAMYRFTWREGHKATYTHGNHRLEMLWTAVPAAILLFIAFAQIRAWEKIKYQSRTPPPDLSITVMARQWEWRMRYPADTDAFAYSEKDSAEEKAQKERSARFWAEGGYANDVHLPNEIHCWGELDEETGEFHGANVKIYLRTQDVLHSFTMPNFRIKQDTLPGKTIPMWFRATAWNTEFDPTTGKCTEPADKRDAWEIACQELCGGRHYAMRGRVYVHTSRKSYENWLAHTKAQQRMRDASEKVAASAPNMIGD
jgi:cytochrome c oxidase subunit 2